MSDISQQASRVGGEGECGKFFPYHYCILPGSGRGAERGVALPSQYSQPFTILPTQSEERLREMWEILTMPEERSYGPDSTREP